MEITPEIITMVVTAIITFLFGWLAKKFNWATKEYIPFQNLCIGLFSGILVYVFSFNENLLGAIILGLFSSMTAGGTYDLSKMKIIDNKEDENNG